MDTCVACHEEVVNAFKTTPHMSAAQDCEGCHGPGQQHAENAGDKTKIRIFRDLSSVDSSAVCMDCHNKGNQKHWMGSMHDSRQVACTSCHNPHGTPNERLLLQTSVNQNCYSCHAEKRGPFLWEHAPVRESCLNCHDAHGSIKEKMLKVKQPLLCQQCDQTSSHPGPAYPAQSRYAFNQGCMHCQPAIHGSVHPSGNRFFR